MIDAKNISFSYDEDEPRRYTIEDLSLHVEKGSFVAVLGHNGSGKSTLAKTFNGILLPQGGAVYVMGMDTKDEEKIFDIRSTAGMVFQNPDNQMVAAIVEDEVAFAPENLGVAPDEIRKRVDECLSVVNMSEFAKSSPSRLSGGQKQRVAIAAVLAMEPECIILDEPTAMLDPKGRREVIKTIKKLNKTRNMTVVLITHFMEEAALADRVVVIDHGKIVMDDVPKKIFSEVEKIKRFGLDVPQVTELIFELRKQGIDLPGDVITVEECEEAIIEKIKGDKND
ncbi:MAG: energy-coupling factor transporter ATPase [Firmicutes bacterium]|nr:energy-coupling factor transporter ATPase [Bacillota bacterium]